MSDLDHEPGAPAGKIANGTCRQLPEELCAEKSIPLRLYPHTLLRIGRLGPGSTRNRREALVRHRPTPSPHPLPQGRGLNGIA